MAAALAHQIDVNFHMRAGRPGDLDALLELESQAFNRDRLSRRSFRRFLSSPNAETLAAEQDGEISGYALVLFRPGAVVARLYSIAVTPKAAGRGIGATLLAAAEEAAIKRGCALMRLEVRADNAAAISRYSKSGYRQFGRHARYYEDGADALRFEKRLTPGLKALAEAPPYFHQTTDFTCGPTCVLMALAWANRDFRPGPGLEFKLWREATTIFMTSGPGGCEPYGLAVTLKRHGLSPEIYVNQPGPYFLETVQSEDKRRVMRVTQAEFRQEADDLEIATRPNSLDESALIQAFHTGAVAIVLVSGYHMVRKGVPHWVFAFGHEAGYILLHDPFARHYEHGQPSGPETYAVPAVEFERMTRFGRKNLRAAVLIRKGPSP
jgi:ribosomal protein S18 acetylase RimI-like enzyme